MSQVVIENPIINSPFEEPKRHYRFNDEGITNKNVINGGRDCSPNSPQQPMQNISARSGKLHQIKRNNLNI